jgi:hypothetical protein
MQMSPLLSEVQVLHINEQTIHEEFELPRGLTLFPEQAMQVPFMR